MPLLALLAFLGVGLPIVLAITLASVPITVQETSGNTYTDRAWLATINNSYLAANNYMLTTGLDTDLTQSSSDRPHMVATDRTAFFLPSLAANTSVGLTYSMGITTPATAMPVILGYGGYLTTAASASVTAGTGAILAEWKGYLTAAGTGALVEKSNSYGLKVETAGTVKAFYDGIDSTNDLNPNANATLGGFTLTGCASEYECIDDGPGHDSDTTYLNTPDTLAHVGTYDLAAGSLPVTGVIDSVTVHAVYKSGSGAQSIQITPALVLGSDVTTGTPVNYSNTAYTTTAETLARPGGGNWALADVASLQVRITVTSSATGFGFVTAVWVRIAYHDSPSVSAAVAAGAHTIQMTKTSGGATTELLVDGVSQGTTVGTETNVRPGTTIRSAENRVSGYTNHVQITLGGTSRLRYEPVTIVSSPLPDASSNGNTGVITWGSTASGVTITVGGITVTPQTINPGVTGGVQEVVGNSPGLNIQNSGNDATGSNLPGYGVVQFLSAAGDFELITVWRLLMGGLLIAYTVFILAKTGGSSGGSRFIQCVAIGIPWALLCALGLFPYPSLILWGLFSACYVPMQRASF